MYSFCISILHILRLHRYEFLKFTLVWDRKQDTPTAETRLSFKYSHLRIFIHKNKCKKHITEKKSVVALISVVKDFIETQKLKSI